MPRLATIQAAGAAPFAAYYESGWDHFAPVEAETIATAIKIGNPASTARAMRAIIATGGVVTSVTDDEIMDAKAVIDRVGIGCEPASAASLAGVRKLVGVRRDQAGRDGRRHPDRPRPQGHRRGHGLPPRRGLRRTARCANRPISIPAIADALEKVLSEHAV